MTVREFVFFLFAVWVAVALGIGLTIALFSIAGINFAELITLLREASNR